jgi:hypothetical protein
MSEWNAMTYEGKDTILRVVRHEAERFFALADNSTPPAVAARRLHRSACPSCTRRPTSSPRPCAAYLVRS